MREGEVVSSLRAGPLDVTRHVSQECKYRAAPNIVRYGTGLDRCIVQTQKSTEPAWAVLFIALDITRSTQCSCRHQKATAHHCGIKTADRVNFVNWCNILEIFLMVVRARGTAVWWCAWCTVCVCVHMHTACQHIQGSCLC